MEGFTALKFIPSLDLLSLKKKIIWTGVHGYWGYIYTHGAHGANLDYSLSCILLICSSLLNFLLGQKNPQRFKHII